MSIASVMPSSHLILWHPLLLLPSIFPSIRGFFNESVFCIRWPKYWCLSFSISPSNEYSGLISLKIDWFDLILVQGTLQSLLQNHSSKASVLWRSAFFTVQLSQLHVTTGKTIALTIWTFVGRVVSLLFNTLSRFVIAFLPRSNSLLISWLQSPSTVILETKKRKSFTTSTIESYIYIHTHTFWYSFLSCLKMFIYLLILFLAVLGLCCCTQAFSVCGEGKWGLPCVVVLHGLLTVVASLVKQRL